jgi:hypothetical protein
MGRDALSNHCLSGCRERREAKEWAGSWRQFIYHMPKADQVSGSREKNLTMIKAMVACFFLLFFFNLVTEIKITFEWCVQKTFPFHACAGVQPRVGF